MITNAHLVVQPRSIQMIVYYLIRIYYRVEMLSGRLYDELFSPTHISCLLMTFLLYFLWSYFKFCVMIEHMSFTSKNCSTYTLASCYDMKVFAIMIFISLVKRKSTYVPILANITQVVHENYCQLSTQLRWVHSLTHTINSMPIVPLITVVQLRHQRKARQCPKYKATKPEKAR